MLFLTVSSSFSEPTVRSLVYNHPKKNRTTTPLHTLTCESSSPIHIQCIHGHQEQQGSAFSFSLRKPSEGASRPGLQVSSNDTTKALTSFLQVATLYVNFRGHSSFSLNGDNGGISWRRFLKGTQTFRTLVSRKGVGCIGLVACEPTLNIVSGVQSSSDLTLGRDSMRFGGFEFFYFLFPLFGQAGNHKQRI